MSPNDAHWSVGSAHRRTAEAPVLPGRGFSASVARLSRERVSGALRRVITTIPGRTPLDQEGAMALDRDAERVLEMVRLAGGPQYLRGPADVEDWRGGP